MESRADTDVIKKLSRNFVISLNSACILGQGSQSCNTIDTNLKQRQPHCNKHHFLSQPGDLNVSPLKGTTISWKSSWL